MGQISLPLNVNNFTPALPSTPKPTTMPAPAASPAPAPTPSIGQAAANQAVRQKTINQAAAQQQYAEQQRAQVAAEAAEKARVAALPSYVDYFSGKSVVAPDQIALQKAITPTNPYKVSYNTGNPYGGYQSSGQYGAYNQYRPTAPRQKTYQELYSEWERNKKLSDYLTASRDFQKRKALETYKAQMAMPMLDDLGAYLQSIGQTVPTVFDPIHGTAWQQAMKQYLANMDPVLSALRNPNIVLPEDLQTAPGLPEGFTQQDLINYMAGKNTNGANPLTPFGLNAKMNMMQGYGSRAMWGGARPNISPTNTGFRILNYLDPNSIDPKQHAIFAARQQAQNFANPKLKQQYEQFIQEANDIYNAVTNPFSVFVYGAKPPKDYVAPKLHETIGPGGVKFGGEPGARALGATNDNPIPKGVEGAGLWAIGIDPRDPRALYQAWNYALSRMGPKDPFHDFSKYLWPDKNGNYQKVLDPKIAGELLKRVDWHVRDTARKIDKSNAFMDTTIGKLVGAALTAWAGGVNPWLGAVVGATAGSQTNGGSWLGALTGGISGGLGGVFSQFTPLTNVNSLLPWGYAARAGEFATKGIFDTAMNWVKNKIITLPATLYEKYLGPNSFMTYANLGQEKFFSSLENDLRRNNIPVRVTQGENGQPALVPDVNSPDYQNYLARNAGDAITQAPSARTGGLMSLRR